MSDSVKKANAPLFKKNVTPRSFFPTAPNTSRYYATTGKRTPMLGLELSSPSSSVESSSIQSSSSSSQSSQLSSLSSPKFTDNPFLAGELASPSAKPLTPRSVADFPQLGMSFQYLPALPSSRTVNSASDTDQKSEESQSKRRRLDSNSTSVTSPILPQTTETLLSVEQQAQAIVDKAIVNVPDGKFIVSKGNIPKKAIIYIPIEGNKYLCGQYLGKRISRVILSLTGLTEENKKLVADQLAKHPDLKNKFVYDDTLFNHNSARFRAFADIFEGEPILSVETKGLHIYRRIEMKRKGKSLK